MVSLVVGAAAHAGHIGSDIGLCHGEASDVFTADKLRDVVLFLLLRPEALNVERRTPALHVEGHPPGGVDLGHLLDGKAALHEPHAVAAVLLVDAEAEETQFGHLVEDLFAPVLVFFVLFHVGLDLVLGKIPCHVLKHLLLGGQFKLHDDILSPLWFYAFRSTTMQMPCPPPPQIVSRP